MITKNTEKSKDKNEVNSLILMLGVISGKLDEMIFLLRKVEKNTTKNVVDIKHIEK